jgi:hypothetical protein
MERFMDNFAEPQICGQVDSDFHPSITLGDDFIKQHVEFINRLFQEGGEKHERIGEHVIKQFFNDDRELASSRNPKKKTSYRKLVNDPDLDVSASTLNRCVRTAVQSRFLQKNGIDSDKLPYYIKLIILALRNDETKAELAREIIAKSLRASQIKNLIDKQRKVAGPMMEEQESKIEQIVRSFHAIREINIYPVLGELAKDQSAFAKLRTEAERLMELVAGLIREIDGNCITPDTLDVEHEKVA